MFLKEWFHLWNSGFYETMRASNVDSMRLLVIYILSSGKSKILDSILHFTPVRGSTEVASYLSIIPSTSLPQINSYCEMLRDLGMLNLVDVTDRFGASYLVTRTHKGTAYLHEGGFRKDSAKETLKTLASAARAFFTFISGLLLIYFPWQTLEYQKEHDRKEGVKVTAESIRREYDAKIYSRDSTIASLSHQMSDLKDSLLYLRFLREQTQLKSANP